MKKCAKCGRELPEENFSKNKAAKDGLQYYCKECQSRDAKERMRQKKTNSNYWVVLKNPIPPGCPRTRRDN